MSKKKKFCFLISKIQAKYMLWKNVCTWLTLTHLKLVNILDNKNVANLKIDKKDQEIWNC